MKNGTRTALLLLGDISMFVGAFVVMLLVAFPHTLDEHIFYLHLLPFSILSIIWVGIFFVFNLYNPQVTKPTIPHLRQIALAFILACTVGIIFFYTIPFFDITPKTNLLIFTGTMFVFFMLWRRVFYAIFSSLFKKKVAFISGTPNLSIIQDIVSYIRMFPQSGFSEVGIYSSLEEYQEKHAGALPELFIVSKDIWGNAENFKKLHTEQNEVMDLAHAYEDILGKIPVDAIDESWFTHNIQHSREVWPSEIIRKIINIILAVFILILLSPFFVAVIMAIKIFDQGPLLYSQTRTGKNGKVFTLYKFRSMVVDAEKDGAEWSRSQDPRVTNVGRIIRTLHIDELPQIFNIIKGDIALVGPRPERPEFVEKLEKEIPFYHLRHIITPGFTGWAQIKFRYASTVLDSKEKFEYDLYYLKNQNIFMDIGIILRTIQVIFTH